MSAMKTCFLIAECSLSYAKIMQMSAMKTCFHIAECSLSYAKIIVSVDILRKKCPNITIFLHYRRLAIRRPPICDIKSIAEAFGRPRRAIPIKLQSESMHFALQTPAYCRPIYCILGGKTHGFAWQGRFERETIKIVRKCGRKVSDCKFSVISGRRPIFPPITF